MSTSQAFGFINYGFEIGTLSSILCNTVELRQEK